MQAKTERPLHFQVVPVKINFINQEMQDNASLVITLGFCFLYVYKFYFIFNSLTCSGGGTSNCLTCDGTKNRNSSALPSCPCKSGFYEAGGALCPSCHHSWFLFQIFLNALTSLTCSGGGSTNCVTCDTTKNRLTSTLPSCKCEIGYFDPGSPQCLECHYSWFNILKLTIN